MKRLTKEYKITPHFELIQMLGSKKIRDMFGITAPAIYKWRNNGIPKDKLELIRFKAPKIYKQWLASVGGKAPQRGE